MPAITRLLFLPFLAYTVNPEMTARNEFNKWEKFVIKSKVLLLLMHILNQSRVCCTCGYLHRCLFHIDYKELMEGSFEFSKTVCWRSGEGRRLLT